MVTNKLISPILLFLSYFLTGCASQTASPTNNYTATSSVSSSGTWGTIFGYILPIIGALAWTPYIINKFTKPKLKGRLISNFLNSGTFANKPCILHFMAFNLISLHKPFNIRDINIQIRYEDSKDVFVGRYFWQRETTSSWVTPDNRRIRLHIPHKDTLPYVGVLPEGEVKTVYVTFQANKAALSEWEWLRIQFTDYSGHIQNLTVEHSQIKAEQMIWDDNIWQDIPIKK